MDYSRAGGPVTANLQSGTATGGAGSDTLSNFEALRGSAFVDTLTGDGLDNWLEGGAGGDSLNGGGGNDTASYMHASSGVIANLASVAANSDEAIGDTYNSIENVFGSRFNDQLTGDGGNNVLDGGFGGNDIMTGAGGADTFIFHGSATTITDFSEGDKLIFIILRRLKSTL